MNVKTEEKKHTFLVNQQEADLIVQALAEVPYKVSAPLITKLQAQYLEQTQKPEASEEKAPADEQS